MSLVPLAPDPGICLRAGSLRGTELKKNVLCPVQCLEVAFHVGKCVWDMTEILSHESEVHQYANTLQSAPEILIVRTVRISQCGCQYGLNTTAEIAHLLSLPLCDFAIVLFRYVESGVRNNFFPSIVKRLLVFMLFQESFHTFHHMFE